MKVLFLPNWINKNPYLSLLQANLKKKGAEVTIDRYEQGLFSLTKTLRKHNDCQIIHIHWVSPYIEKIFKVKPRFLMPIICILNLLDLFLCSRIKKKKFIWTIHNKYTHESKSRYLEKIIRRALFQMCEKIIIHSHLIIPELVRSYNLKNTEKFVVISHGHYIDTYPNTINKLDARKLLNIDEDQTVLLYFGRIRQYKGLPLLITEFNKLSKDMNLKLIIAGELHNETYKNDLWDVIKGNGAITCYFEFVAPNKIQNFMNAADACIFPFDEVLTSGSVILAMSFAKAIIAPRKGCLTDILDEQGAIFLDESTDITAAINKCTQLDLKSMGDYNKNSIQKYNWEDIGSKLYKVYST